MVLEGYSSISVLLINATFPQIFVLPENFSCSTNLLISGGLKYSDSNIVVGRMFSTAKTKKD